MTTPDSPASLLRRAADHLNELAEAASGERWEALQKYPEAWEVRAVGLTASIAEESGHGDIPEGDARWMATLGPQIAPALSAWLRNAAQDAEEIGPNHHAVTLARALLGEEA